MSLTISINTRPLTIRWNEVTQESTHFFDELALGEKNLLTFNFAPGLVGGNLISAIVSTVVTLWLGTDPSPNSLLIGTISVDPTSKMVTVPVYPLVANTQYKVKVTCATNVTVVNLVLAGIVTVGS